MSAIRTLAELEAIYGEAMQSSTDKEVDQLTELHCEYVRASPFVLVATSGPGGLDCSPRGDPAGFVHIADERTLIMPDRRGNNRLRVNGTAEISSDLAHREDFAMGDKLPATVIIVTTTSVYTQCPTRPTTPTTPSGSARPSIDLATEIWRLS